MADPAAGDAEYTVVVRSRSGARVRRGYYIDLPDFPDGLGGHVQVRVSTRWEELGLDYPVPRELWMAIRTRGPSVDAAVRGATQAASAVALIVSFCANAAVEPPALHVVFNSTAGLARREFLEVFVPDEVGLPRPGRWLDANNFFAFGQAAFASPEAPRLFRALAQYQAALRYWNTGARTLVLVHLYIACEVLTKSVLRVNQTRLGVTEKEHAQLLGVDISRSNWQMMAGNFARREYIFEGNKEVYDAARTASDQFEHGMADLGVVRQAADSVTRELFDLVRSAILSVAFSLDPVVSDALMSRGPVDVSPLYKQITGYIVSDGPSDPLNLGPVDELFPMLRWSSRIKTVRLDDDNVAFEPLETWTVRFAPGLGFETRDLAIYGGLNPSPEGSAPSRSSGWDQGNWVTRQVAAGDLKVVKRDLLEAVRLLVDATAASGAEITQTVPQMLAFNLFGQGVAYLRGAQTLIVAGLPVEALPLLRGLVNIAARFEQITDEDGEGLGLVIRLVLDSLNDQVPDSVRDQEETAKDNYLRVATEMGLSVPSSVRTVEGSSIWRSLTTEMQMSDLVVEASYGVSGLHVTPNEETNTIGFNVQLEPGPFTDLIASACAMAQLDLLKHAAPVFGWTVNAETLDELLAEAKQINETSIHTLTGP
jgi:hypothetical protein